MLSIALYVLVFYFKTINTVKAVPILAQSSQLTCRQALCETIKIVSNSSNYTIENAQLLKIDVEIKNCLDTVFKLSVDANVGKKNNHNACFTIDLKKI